MWNVNACYVREEYYKNPIKKEERKGIGDGTIDGMSVADYYTEYGYLVHKKLTKLLAELGYGVEWWDSGTIYAYPE